MGYEQHCVVALDETERRSSSSGSLSNDCLTQCFLNDQFENMNQLLYHHELYIVCVCVYNGSHNFSSNENGRLGSQN